MYYLHYHYQNINKNNNNGCNLSDYLFTYTVCIFANFPFLASNWLNFIYTVGIFQPYSTFPLTCTHTTRFCAITVLL